jgi:hypothetical protein
VTNDGMPERLKIISFIALLAFGFGSLASNVWARGRSFPIEMTGVITSVSKPAQTFTINVDEPASVLTIGLKYDCKFMRHGVPADAGILKRGARVKVSCFSTLFTGKLAVEVEANPVPQLQSGTVEKIEPADRKLTIRVSNCSNRLVFRWAASARFIRYGKSVSPASLRQDALVEVSYFSLPFEKKYAVRIELERP